MNYFVKRLLSMALLLGLPLLISCQKAVDDKELEERVRQIILKIEKEKGAISNPALSTDNSSEVQTPKPFNRIIKPARQKTSQEMAKIEQEAKMVLKAKTYMEFRNLIAQTSLTLKMDDYISPAISKEELAKIVERGKPHGEDFYLIQGVRFYGLKPTQTEIRLMEKFFELNGKPK
ncbi:MAG: hypothetical protein A2X86_04010 [Bdellovibrionales bacterium GWA2_49_15]|nr:MAG: hypothetical protein A2X86_04010 [Bdellovibrionales bacterium GWA2_49_15]HAZ12382.1 hypothetical protein [Bdellovibrionales bacterium]